MFKIGDVKFPDEKVRYEVATMQYIAAKTTIPVPKIHHCGTSEENPLNLGPFIIMDYVEHDMNLSDLINDPALEEDDSHRLNPNIDLGQLETIYRQMANVLLQLSRLSFPRIGSLIKGSEDEDFEVAGRPLIQNMNHLVEFSGIVPSLLPSKPYETAQEWYCAMADMHLAQLVFQHNDAVEDEDDARDKYVARILFRRLACSGKLAAGFGDNTQQPSLTHFTLFSEDLRPSNVLIDKDVHFASVIDWEFAYAAPAQFSADPPWWLILRHPEYWPDGYDAWLETYEPRLEFFLKILEEEEQKLRNASPGETSDGPALSERMRQSWEDKTWMISYAARRSYALDFLYWRFLDSRFFGPNEVADHHARIELLTDEEKSMMEDLVKVKKEESTERILPEWDDKSAAEHLARFTPGI